MVKRIEDPAQGSVPAPVGLPRYMPGAFVRIRVSGQKAQVLSCVWRYKDTPPTWGYLLRYAAAAVQVDFPGGSGAVRGVSYSVGSFSDFELRKWKGKK